MLVSWHENTEGFVAFTIKAENPAEAMVIKWAIRGLNNQRYGVDGYTVEAGKPGFMSFTLSPRELRECPKNTEPIKE
jgi:hypothetical protein